MKYTTALAFVIALAELGSAAPQLKRQGQAVNGSDCLSGDQCQSGFCGPQEGRVTDTCQDPNAQQGGNGGNTGTAVNGSDCLSGDQCQSGFCGPQEGRVTDTCQDPSSQNNNPNNQEQPKTGSAVNGSDCLSGDQCLSGFCGPSGGATDTCQDPNASQNNTPTNQEDQSDDPQSHVQTGFAVNGSDCLSDDQCVSGFCGPSGGATDTCQDRPANNNNNNEENKDEKKGKKKGKTGSAVNGSECASDDQCQSGNCVESGPVNTCQP